MRVRAYVGRLVPPVVFVLLLPVALAAPTVMQRDRADNSMSFTYDADDNDVTQATSSLRIRRGDPVQFTTTVDDLETDPPIRGWISLRLIEKRTVVYDGTFTFHVRDTAGSVVFRASRHASFTLRSQPGKRTKDLSFRFDLPSGDYSVTSTFVASE